MNKILAVVDNLRRGGLKMDNSDYYTAPSDEVFEEIKNACIAIWSTYDDTHGYASEKINKVNSITNFKDNVWGMV